MRARTPHLEDAKRGQRGRRRNHSGQELKSGNWLYIVENDFALTISKSTDLWVDLQRQPTITKKCQDRSSFSLLSRPPRKDIGELTVNVAKLREAADLWPLRIISSMFDSV
jgi:hypothetical protein